MPSQTSALAVEQQLYQRNWILYVDNKIKNSRSNFDKLGSVYKVAENIEIEKEIIEAIPCYWFCKKNTKLGAKLIMYLHGGCFVLGSINSHKALVSHLAKEIDIPILFVEYSLAPEHPFPAAINDILKVYNYVVDIMEIQNVSIIGDSVGAGLTISIVSILNKENNHAKPENIVMISPWVDLRNNSDSITNNAGIDPILTQEGLHFYTSLYMANNRLSVANPIETLYGNFPPALIVVGSNEILLDDSRIVFSKIRANQPLTKLIIYENETHVWLLDNIDKKSSKQAIEEIKKFIADQIK